MNASGRCPRRAAAPRSAAHQSPGSTGPEPLHSLMRRSWTTPHRTAVAVSRRSPTRDPKAFSGHITRVAILGNDKHLSSTESLSAHFFLINPMEVKSFCGSIPLLLWIIPSSSHLALTKSHFHPGIDRFIPDNTKPLTGQQRRPACSKPSFRSPELGAGADCEKRH